MNQLLRIVPPQAGPGQFVRTQGTQVLLPSGEKVEGVTSITLFCNLDNVWRAQIECMAQPPDVTCLSDVRYRRTQRPLSLLQWAKSWWAYYKLPRL